MDQQSLFIIIVAFYFYGKNAFSGKEGVRYDWYIMLKSSKVYEGYIECHAGICASAMYRRRKSV